MSDEEIIASAKEEIKVCDQESAKIRAALRTLGTTSDEADNNEEEANKNSLTIRFLKVDGLPDGADPKLTLQLSSPIEEAEISLSASPECTFHDVETGQATLTVSSAKDGNDIPLGSSASYDVAKFTNQLLDVFEPKENYKHMLSVDIMSDEGSEEEKICTIEIETTYSPSKKDQREELYELLNKCTVRKQNAREKWRKAETTLAAAGSNKPRGSTSTGPAVRAGFLNKNSGDKAAGFSGGLASKWKLWYNRMQVVVPVAKNYVFFGVFVVFAHYQGHKLTIPAPV